MHYDPLVFLVIAFALILFIAGYFPRVDDWLYKRLFGFYPGWNARKMKK